VNVEIIYVKMVWINIVLIMFKNLNAFLQSLSSLFIFEILLPEAKRKTREKLALSVSDNAISAINIKCLSKSFLYFSDIRNVASFALLLWFK
jgi:hypothetical protein